MGEFLGPYAISGKAIDQQLAESGVYQALLTNTPGDIAADCTAAADECTTGDDETWDFSGGKTLTLVINGRVNDPITIDFVDGDFVDAEAGLAAEVKAVLDADADFAAVATSAVTNTNHVTITTKALGTTAELYASGTANDVMGFVEVGAKVNGETDPSTVEISTVNGANDGAVARKQVAISVLDAVTAGRPPLPLPQPVLAALFFCIHTPACTIEALPADRRTQALIMNSVS